MYTKNCYSRPPLGTAKTSLKQQVVFETRVTMTCPCKINTFLLLELEVEALFWKVATHLHLYTGYVMRKPWIHGLLHKPWIHALRNNSWIVCTSCGSTLCQAPQTNEEGHKRKEGLRLAAQGDVRDSYLGLGIMLGLGHSMDSLRKVWIHGLRRAIHALSRTHALGITCTLISYIFVVQSLHIKHATRYLCTLLWSYTMVNGSVHAKSGDVRQVVTDHRDFSVQKHSCMEFRS